jgi:hypothetical protein
MTLKEAEVLALSTLKQVMEEKVGAWGWGGRAGGCACCLRCVRISDPSDAARTCTALVLLPTRGIRETTLQVTALNVDIASVAPKWHLYTPEEGEEVIGRL